ncbi:putative enterotoxin [Ophiocordyceps unilateralis]|uniref:Enterotoxin n=1 Tax=Ophiocordyceps unilateralis TaxID=268505 RepID=A0A2A9PC79_OPHUN|nr:putative enterotoxin [Ophiocordyceps unilateralis]
MLVVVVMLCLVFLGFVSAASPDRQQPQSHRNLTIVYRWDYRSPRQVRAAGGFLPPYYDYDDNARAFYINHHVLGEFDEEGRPRERNWRTAYVSVYGDWMGLTHPGGWLYRIHASPNMIMPMADLHDVFAFRGGIYAMRGDVFALGGIHWSQIMAYTYLESTHQPVGRMTGNREYQELHYDHLTTTSISPAVSPCLTDPAQWNCFNGWRWAHSFMSRPNIGSALGWLGCFPLVREVYGHDGTVPGPRPFTAQRTSAEGSAAGSQQHCQPGPFSRQCQVQPGSEVQGNELGHCDSSRADCQVDGPQSSTHCVPRSFAQIEDHCLRHASGTDQGQSAASTTPQDDCTLSFSDMCQYSDQLQVDEEWVRSLLNPPSPTTNAETSESPTPETSAEPMDQDEGGPPAKKQKPDDSFRPAQGSDGGASSSGSGELAFGDEDYRSSLAALAASCQLTGSQPPFSRRKRSDPVVYYGIADCDDAIGKIRKLDACERIQELEIGFKLSDSYWSGTYSEISAVLEGRNSQNRVPITVAPERGFQKWIPVSPSQASRSNTYELHDIQNITLATRERRGYPTRDRWTLQDLELRARCAITGNRVQMTKYRSLNKVYRGPYNWDVKKWDTVDRLTVAPADWRMRPPCTYLRRLILDFKLGNKFFGGTSNTIAFVVGPMLKPMILAKKPTAGFSKRFKLNLDALFGINVVKLDSLTSVSLEDHMNDYSLGDAWFFEGLTLSGECVGSGKWVHVKKFQAVNRWLAHQSLSYKLEVAWVDTISPEDWSY